MLGVSKLKQNASAPKHSWQGCAWDVIHRSDEYDNSKDHEDRRAAEEASQLRGVILRTAVQVGIWNTERFPLPERTISSPKLPIRRVGSAGEAEVGADATPRTSSEDGIRPRQPGGRVGPFNPSTLVNWKRARQQRKKVEATKNSNDTLTWKGVTLRCQAADGPVGRPDSRWGRPRARGEGALEGYPTKCRQREERSRR